jgi:hypothetical protein
MADTFIATDWIQKGRAALAAGALAAVVLALTSILPAQAEMAPVVKGRISISATIPVGARILRVSPDNGTDQSSKAVKVCNTETPVRLGIRPRGSTGTRWTSRRDGPCIWSVVQRASGYIVDAMVVPE